MVKRLMSAALACGLALSPAHAALIRYDFSGTLYATPFLASGAAAPTLASAAALPASTYNGFVVFDTAASDLNLSPSIAAFAAQNFLVTVGGLTFTPLNATAAAGVQSNRFGLTFAGQQDISGALGGLETTNFSLISSGSGLSLSPVQTPSTLYSIYGQGSAATSGSYTIYRGATPTSFTSQMVAAPEPSTWMMLLGGFGLVGWAMRGRARKAKSYAPTFT